MVRLHHNMHLISKMLSILVLLVLHYTLLQQCQILAHDCTEMEGGDQLLHLKFQKALLLKLKDVTFIMVWGLFYCGGSSLTSRYMRILEPLSSTGTAAIFKPQCNGSSTEKMQCSPSWTAAIM